MRFDLPAHEWLREALRILVPDNGLGATDRTGLFRRQALEGLVRQHAPISDIISGGCSCCYCG
jgi:hypothetical protein